MADVDDRGNTRIIPAASQSSYDNFHFAPAVRDGDNLRLSGVIGTDARGKADPDATTQFRQAFAGVAAVLAEAGADMADVTEFTTFHVDLQKHMGTFMKVKDEFVTAPYPAWTAIGITELAIPGALVEIQVIARKLDS